MSKSSTQPDVSVVHFVMVAVLCLFSAISYVHHFQVISHAHSQDLVFLLSFSWGQ
jgi:hypothetical protein